MRLGVIIQCVVVQHQLYCILEDLAHISIKQEAKKIVVQTQMVERKLIYTVQPNLPVFFKRASLAVFIFYALLNIAELRLTPLCKSNKIYTKERNYESIF